MKRSNGSGRTVVQIFGTALAVLASAGALLATCASGANAAPPASWMAETVAPTYFVPGRTSSLAVVASDTTPASEITINDIPPAGVEVKSISLFWSGFDGGSFDLGKFFPCSSPTEPILSCHLPVTIEPGQTVRMVLRLGVPASTPEGSISNDATVESGGIASGQTTSQIATSVHPAFAITNFTTQLDETTREEALPGGEYEFVNEPYRQPFTQAGAHPWALTTTFELATEAQEANDEGEIPLLPTHDPKNVVAALPPGLLGDPLAVPRCSLALVTSKLGLCPGDTQIGVWRIRHDGIKELLGPVVNVTPESGQSAEFALENQDPSIVTPLLTAHLVRTGEGYGFDVADTGVPTIGLRRVELTFWGVPADPSHNAMRGRLCGKDKANIPLTCSVAGGEQSHLPPVPFLSLPTDCAAGPQTLSLRADSWQEPVGVAAGARYAEGTTPFPAVTGCNLLQFNAGTGVTVEPDTQTADQPVGLGVGLQIPLNESPATNTTPALRGTLVTLPEGMSVSPGIVDGIQACDATGPHGINITGPESEAPGFSGEPQLAPGHCPDASIVGTAEAITPFLPTPVKGHVYLARPGCGGQGQAPCTEQDVRDGNLYRLYLELGGSGQFANTGIEFKVPLETEVNPATGQITAVSRDLVQALYNEVKIRLNGGPRAPIANPAVCGPALTTADFTPWSAPGRTPEGLLVAGTPDLMSSSHFEVTGCTNPPPFKPGLTAGTVTAQAAQFSSFTLDLSRQDGEQYVKGIQVHTPPGLLGMLSSVPLCEEPQADAGTCPQASKIGTTRVATGAGSHPFEIEGDVFLTGPYGGSPFGLSVVVHVVAGPFNLGLKVVRARIAVDPTTSQLTVTTDETGPYAVPQIVFGVPVRLKRITVNIDRPGFMFNPSNCAAQQITADISGSQDSVAHLSSPFAVGGCGSLAFKPKFTVTTSGHTNRVRGASLDVKLSYPAGSVGSEANIASAKVDLPRQLPSRLSTLQKACPAATFATNPVACPAGSIVGAVRVRTPLLPVELTGPVYFVSHGGEQFPSLIVVLQGDGVRVDLTGTTFINKANITSSTFKLVPDVPVSTFELYLPQGRFSALAANGNLCKAQAKLRMPTRFVAQNGAVFKQSTKIAVSGCAGTGTVARAHANQSKNNRGRAGR